MEKLILRDLFLDRTQDDHSLFLYRHDFCVGKYRETDLEGAVGRLEFDNLKMNCREEGPERVAAMAAGKAARFGRDTGFDGVYESGDELELVFTKQEGGDVSFYLYWEADAPASDCKRYLDDISREEADAAFSAGSCGGIFSRKEYTDLLQGFRDKLEFLLYGKKNAERREAEFQAFREGLKLVYQAYLRAAGKSFSFSSEGKSWQEVEALFRQTNKAERLKDMRHLHVEMYAALAVDEAERTLSRDGGGSLMPVPGDGMEKVRACLGRLKAVHSYMVEVNRVLHRAGKDRVRRAAELYKMGLDEKAVEKVLRPDELSNVGFPSYAMCRSLGRIKVAERMLKEAMESEEA